MMTRLRRQLYFFLLIFPLSAQGASWGSGYSQFGIGELRYFPHERSAGMGGAHIALLTANSINTMNPAAWTLLNRMRFSIGTSYEGYSIKNASSSTFLSGASFNGVAFAIPISTENGFVATAGLTPYSAVNYNVVSDVIEPPFSYTLKNIGEGGLSTAYLGASVSLAKRLHLGAKFNYLFGTLNRNSEQLFHSTQYTNVSLNRSTQLNGASVSLGAIYSGLGNMLGVSASDQINVGVLFSTGAKLTARQENHYEYTSGISIIGRDTLVIAEGNASLPLAYGVGVNYVMRDRYSFAADFYFQQWKSFEIFGSHPSQLRDGYRLSVGAEILPLKDASASYSERTSYQLGLFYHATNLRVKGKDINEIGFTGGVGLPLFGDTRLTISAEYSIRGTIDIEKDNILRVSFTLNTGESWFVRPPEE